ncbi:MAG: hypothetical protein ACO38D_07555, partial [Ilumatobacteraceae bacterium]
MSFLRSRRRRATVIAVVSGLVVAALLPVSAVVAWRAVRDSRAAEAVIAVHEEPKPAAVAKMAVAEGDIQIGARDGQVDHGRVFASTGAVGP